MKFEKYRISDEIKTNLTNIGFHKTTDIQFKAIPPIMNGEDVLAIAQTGTGKTGAFAIPIINSIQELKEKNKEKFLKTLILVPTRELTKQIGKVFSQLAKNTRVTSYAVYGGVDQDPQIDQLIGGVDILIATPGRMFDLIYQGFIEVDRVKTLVLDEADHMLDLGFIRDIDDIKKKLPKRHQTLFFSATINQKIKKLAYSQIQSDAMRIQVSPQNLVSENVSHFLTRVEMDEKRHLLTNFLKESGDSKTIVFVRTQVRVGRVLKHLAKNGIECRSLHGGMEQDEREENLEAFRAIKSGALIATDISARGIDLPSVTHVINYDLPDDPENYVHRVGRTGRGFATGDALSFCAEEENDKLLDIEDFIQMQIPMLEAKGFYKQELIDADDLDLSDLIEVEEKNVFGENYQKEKKKKKKGKR